MSGSRPERPRVEVPYSPLTPDGADAVYRHGPDSVRRRGVAAGTTSRFELTDSAVYPGTRRSFWVHVATGHDAAAPAHLAVFQDGGLYLDPNGEVRGAIVLDNLVARGEIPATVGVFVDPGVSGREPGERNRNVEYDAFDARYTELLLTEVLPIVGERWALSEDPDERLICGGSSGGNCALTAAWLRPDAFGRVISYLASFAQMPEGNPYPELLRASERRDLRVFLQAAHRDLGWDRPQRNWLAENLRVAAALAENGHELRLVLGDGGHSPNHGGVLLPDALRWHWGSSPVA